MVLIFQFILSLFLLYIGAEIIINTSIVISNKLKIPRIIIGLTIVSFATSLPELFVSLQAALKNASDFAIGNIIGSNISNITLVLGATSIVYPIVLQKEEFRLQYVSLLLTTIFFCFCFFNLDTLNHNYGIISILLLTCFNIFLFVKGVSIVPHDFFHDNNLKILYFNFNIKSNLVLIIIAIIGSIILWLASEMLIDSSRKIAHLLSISDRIISLTLVAVGTSLPELIASIYSAFKKETKLAIGNLLGSNIFNILSVIGFTSLITDLKLNSIMNYDIVIMFLFTMLLVPTYYIGKGIINRRVGFIILFLYITYILSILI